ncbi:hypothetical protein GF385_03860 [Candidatus Dependentiae bacterium]|nr:hypothetical protein [Candidatus Dependentiae bacterium]
MFKFLIQKRFIIFFIVVSIFNVDFISGKGVVSSETLLPPISQPKKHKRVHAATIAEVSKDHLIVAYFGGTCEGEPDVKIWLSHGKAIDGEWFWKEPYIVADSNEILGEENKPCYNPVLFKFNKDTILLFYKIGNSPREWKGYLKRSDDGGKTWTEAEDLFKYNGAVGPTRCKPIRLNENSILCGSSVEGNPFSWLPINWVVKMEIFNFFPGTSKISSVKRSKDIATPYFNRVRRDPNYKYFRSRYPYINITGIIQPASFFADGSNEEIKIVCRGKGTKYLISSISNDGGKSWGSVKEEIDLVNGGGLHGSGIDSVKLKDGNILIVRNELPDGIKNGQCGDRSKLVLDVSRDNGKNWKTIFVLEDTLPIEGKENCYPSIIQSSDGLVHIVYTFDKNGDKSSIKHVVLDPELLIYK